MRESENLCEEALAVPGGTTRDPSRSPGHAGPHQPAPRPTGRLSRQRLAELDDVVRGQASFPPSSEVLSSFLTRARLAHADSAWHEALAICENGIAKADECGDLPRGLSLRCLKADACRRLDRLDTAARTLAEAREMADGAPLPLLAELQRAHASLLAAAAPGNRARPAVESSLRVLSAIGGADARRDGVVGYLQAERHLGSGLHTRLTARPWDVSPIVRGTLPGRTSKPIPTRGVGSIPDLLDLAPLAHLASRPALLAQEAVHPPAPQRLRARPGPRCHPRRDGRSTLRAHEGWSAAAAVAAAHRPGLRDDSVRPGAGWPVARHRGADGRRPGPGRPPRPPLPHGSARGARGAPARGGQAPVPVATRDCRRRARRASSRRRRCAGSWRRPGRSRQAPCPF